MAIIGFACRALFSRATIFVSQTFDKVASLAGRIFQTEAPAHPQVRKIIGSVVADSMDERFLIDMPEWGDRIDVRQVVYSLLTFGMQDSTYEELLPVFNWLNRQPKLEYEIDEELAEILYRPEDQYVWQSLEEEPPLQPPFEDIPRLERIGINEVHEIWRGSKYAFFPKFFATLVQLRIDPETIKSFFNVYVYGRPLHLQAETRDSLTTMAMQANLHIVRLEEYWQRKKGCASLFQNQIQVIDEREEGVMA